MRVALRGLASTQAHALLFIFFVLGHEAQAVGRVFADPTNETPVVGTGTAPWGDASAATAAVRVGNRSGAAARRLVPVLAHWQWPTNTHLAFEAQHGSPGTVTTSGTAEVLACASLLYSAMEIKAPGVPFGSDHSAARVKLVKNTADRTKCSGGTYDVPVGIVSRQSGVAVNADMGLSHGPLALSLDSDKLYATSAKIVFMQGGLYKLCYTPDGTFGRDGSQYKDNVVNTVIRVFGVQSPCIHGLTDGCMESERWECSFGYKGESVQNCEFNLKTDGGRGGGAWRVEPGQRSKMSWTSLYGADTLTAAGQLQSSLPRFCEDGTAPEKSTFDFSQSGYYLQVDQTTAAMMPPVKPDRTAAFTLAACYCPNYNAAAGTYCGPGDAGQCCNDDAEYIQQFGVIYFWTIRICDYSNYLSCDAPTRYMRVVPQQKFVLRIECPPGGGCAGTTANRIMYIDHSANNNRPTWDMSSGCQAVASETSSAVWPSTADAQAAVDGGDRVDYKVWRNKQVKINLSLNKQLDVCYCNADCSLSPKIQGNWFRVGQVRTTAAFAFASKTADSSSYESVRYAGLPGSITLYGGIGKAASDTSTMVNPYDSNMYSGKALMNIVSYDREKRFGTGQDKKTLEKHFGFDRAMPLKFQERMDEQCRQEWYWPTLVTGPNTKQGAKAYVARVDALDNTVQRYLTFSGESKDNMMTVNMAGVVAICYCAVVTPQLECESAASWIFAGRTTIQGPAGGQQWILPTHIVVKLTVHGWGLSHKDRLRIIPASSSCSGNSNNPEADTSIKVGCPAKDGTGCRAGTVSEELPVKVVTAVSSGIFINSIQTGLKQSTLQFSGSVQHVLKADDMITIDLDRVLVNGKSETSMGAAEADEEFDAYKLSGQYQFQDDQTKSYVVGHRVSNVVVGGVTDFTKMSIPVGWNSGPTFSFVNGKGHWMRRSEIETDEDVKATQARPGLKVCWGVNDAITKFYTQAGEVSFEDPPQMSVARVSFTTKQRGAVSPVVISFQTSPQRTEYAGAEGRTMLMIRFLDVSNSPSAGKLVPHFTGDAAPGGSGPESIPTSGTHEEVAPSGMKQWVCGRLFAELWSSHSEGFPLPAGCYYGKKYRDQSVSATAFFYREVFIVFSEKNGLRNNTEYQIVMNAQVKDVTAQENLLDLYAMCAEEAGCERPYKVFEKGSAVASLTTEATSGDGDPKLADFEIERGGASHTLNLSDESILQVKIVGGSLDVNMIQKQQFIRVFLWPLTLWSIGNAECSAKCYPGAGAICQGSVGCTPEEVVPASNRKNSIRLQLPAEMTPISNITTHTIKITGLALPLAGYFPLRVGVQLTSVSDEKPQYTTSNGFLMKNPEAGQTTGRLVSSGRTGSGPKPFQGDAQNTLCVRLQFGATVQNFGHSFLAAQFEITLPEGYSCGVLGGAAPEKDLGIFAIDDDADGYPDNNRGILSPDSADGDWDNSAGKVCAYEVNTYNALFAGQVVYVKLTVDNPAGAMSKPYDKNVWRLKLSSMGANPLLTAPVDVTEVQFISLAEEKQLNAGGQAYWASNAAVITRLEAETLQPSDFTRSCCGPRFNPRRVEEYVHVFFQTTQYVGQNGFVILDAPPGFDFTRACTAADLDREYYAFIGIYETSIHRLKSMRDCTGSIYPPTTSTPGATPAAHNRARFQVGGLIGDGKYYGFKIQVTHPTQYLTSQHDGWFLWTQDSNGYSIEGSNSTIKFNKLQNSSHTEFHHKSFGMYDANASISVRISDIRPKSLAQTDTYVTFYPIDFLVDTDTSLRITAPVGFVWADPSPGTGNFERTTDGTTEEFPMPTEHFENQMVWSSMSLKGRTKYGFQAKVAVPDHNPVTSSNAFFIEFGFQEQDIESRYMAAVVRAPLVGSVLNAEVAYNSNLVNYVNNRLEFSFQLVSMIQEGDGIVIKGDYNTRGFTFTCSLTMLPGSAALPPDILCMNVPAKDLLPQITLKVQETPVQPGYFKFELPFDNPTEKIISPGRWTFGTYRSVAYYPNTPQVDKELLVPGFTINEPLADGRLIWISAATRQKTGRDDRPGKENHLIFRFQLTQKSGADQDLILRAPRGFEFDENCMHVLVAASNDVFGANTGSQWPVEYTEWPPRLYPQSCLGFGRDARIRIPAGLLDRNLYLFRIGVKNPMVTPEWNRWSINYNSETSEPFAGFTVWAFTSLSVTSTSLAKSPNPPGGLVELTVNAVTITFQPFNSIPSLGGLLRVTAPEGFEFVEQNSECRVELFETGGMLSFGKGDTLCKIDSKRKLLLYLTGSKAMEGGKGYTLIVRVFNPPGTTSAFTWSLESFQDTSSEPSTPLDTSHVMGFPINNVLTTFIVSNVNNVHNGGAKVYDVDITLRFPDPLKDGDEVVVFGPKGFNLQGNTETKTCNDFQYAGQENPLPASGDPRCTCQAQVCMMKWIVSEFKDEAYPENKNIRFQIATENPSRIPFITDNFWKAEHRRGQVVKSSHVHPSWTIVPQLSNVDVKLKGSKLAASAESDISVQFTPVSDAGTLKLEALSPNEFDFGRATVSAPYDIDDRSEGAVVLINRLSLVGGKAIEIRINSVMLGRAGGQTRWNLITYADEALAEKRDEQLDFAGGFRLPGRVTVLGTPQLNSQYRESKSSFPVKSLFQARVLEDAKAEFLLSFSQDVTAAQKLVITSQGAGAYILRRSPFVIMGSGRVETRVEMDAKGSLLATLLPGRPAADVALHASTPYTLTMWVFPRPGTNNWRFETKDTLEYPTNTNDGETPGFSPVEKMTLTVAAQRSPPQAMIDVTLNVEQGSAVVRELLVIAPPGFSFDERAAGCGDSCTPGRPLGSTGRRTATIASPTGMPLATLRGLVVRVRTPMHTPDSISWFVEGRGPGAGATAGWGEGAGFRVTQMPGSTVSYGGVANLWATRIAFTFQMDVPGGSQVTVVPPAGIRLTCSPERALQKISLPGGQPRCIDYPLRLVLTQPLTRGTYAFAVEADMPPRTPEVNAFDLIVRDRDENIIDAAYQIQGQRVVDIGVGSPTLAWSSADPGRTSMITVGVAFTRDTRGIKALLINLPRGFVHDVQKPDDVQSLNGRFPVADGSDWADTSEPNAIKISLDHSPDSAILADDYKFRFPVQIPSEVPPINLWYLSLCDALACTDHGDRSTIVSFPLEGFDLHEVSPVALRAFTGSAKQKLDSDVYACTHLAAVVALLMTQL